MAPGDIVRHADYPQWGCGYVIRAKKASSDVFFRWGGKRRIDVGEPLEPSRASRVEAEFFSLFAGLSAGSWSRGHHSVYAIELDRVGLEEPSFPRAQSRRRGRRMPVHRGDRADAGSALRATPGGHAVRSVRPRSWPQAEARPRGGVLAPALPDRGLHGAEARRMASGTGVRGVAELIGNGITPGRGRGPRVRPHRSSGTHRPAARASSQ